MIVDPLRAAALASFVLALPVAAQSSPGSFEAPRYHTGPLAGNSLSSGQDGWILLESNYPANLAAVPVQTAVVRSGAQAVRFDASQFVPGDFVELRRNDLFAVTGVLEIEFDFLATSSPNPSEWEVYSQPYPIPASCYLRWWIADDGRIEFLDTPSRVLVQSNTWVTRDVWHHTRSVVDFAANETRIYLDGVLVATGTPIATMFLGADHGFTEINAYDAGDDQLYVDNFTVRDRTAANGLTLDLAGLPIDQRSVVTLQLAGADALANRPYALLASLSGTSPGTSIGAVTLPLNWDGFTSVVLETYGSGALPGFFGTLSADATATATFDTNIPVPPALLGLHVDFAWLTVAPFDAVSESAGCVVVQ
ncbi:MAG: hypothetical protein H6835_03030 [Planctomycetes bacterium]|nr:hypothetical protein [Planctomycetota bacterium]